MNAQTVAANVIRKYLLGQTSEAERLDLEERLLADDDTYEELLIVENELTDEYLRGRLSQTELKNFETHFLLAPSRQEKLRFARAVQEHLSTHVPAKKVIATPRKSSLPGFLAFRNPVLSYALGIAVVLLVVGISWLVLRNSTSPRSTIALTLTPGLTRSESSVQNSVRIPPTADIVRLQLLLTEDGSYQAYNAVLQSSDGRTVAKQPAHSSESINGRRVVAVELPSTLLPAGEYRIKLSGVFTANETVDLESYSFKVVGP